MKARLAACLAMALASAAPALWAHEFWIEPSSFRPAVGAPLLARLRVGENFQGDPVARKESHLRRFVLADAAGESPLLGAEGRDPAGFLRVGAPGFQVLGYESNATAVTLDPEKVGIYLDTEGLAPFFTGDRRQPMDDYFSRCAKALLFAGPGDPAAAKGFDRKLGFFLELIPEANPLALASGAGLPLRLLLDGKPLEGALISARGSLLPLSRLTARTDAAGRAVLPIAGSGVWLLNAVYLRPARSGEPATYESWWASLTFEIP